MDARRQDEQPYQQYLYISPRGYWFSQHTTFTKEVSNVDAYEGRKKEQEYNINNISLSTRGRTLTISTESRLFSIQISLSPICEGYA